MINANDLNGLRISLASSLPDWMIADGKLFGAFFAKTSRLYYTNSIKIDPKNHVLSDDFNSILFNTNSSRNDIPRLYSLAKRMYPTLDGVFSNKGSHSDNCPQGNCGCEAGIHMFCEPPYVCSSMYGCQAACECVLVKDPVHGEVFSGTGGSSQGQLMGYGWLIGVIIAVIVAEKLEL